MAQKSLPSRSAPSKDGDISARRPFSAWSWADLTPVFQRHYIEGGQRYMHSATFAQEQFLRSDAFPKEDAVVQKIQERFAEYQHVVGVDEESQFSVYLGHTREAFVTHVLFALVNALPTFPLVDCRLPSREVLSSVYGNGKPDFSLIAIPSTTLISYVRSASVTQS